MAPDAISDRSIDDDANKQRQARRTWVTLRSFKRDLLVTIAALEATGDAPYGLQIKEVLSAASGEDINHGRLYPNLDELVDAGLLSKGSKDKRTNTYELTGAGDRVLEAGAARLAEVTGDV